MPKFQITVSKREQEWSKENDPLQSSGMTQSQLPDTPGFGGTPVQSGGGGGDTPGLGRSLQSVTDTPGYSAHGGDLSPLAD